MSPFQGLFFSVRFDGRCPSLVYVALSGLIFFCSFRWALPIASVCRPFRAYFFLFVSMGVAHRWCMSPFQGLFFSVRFDGRCPSLVYVALSGLIFFCSFRWALPIV